MLTKKWLKSANLYKFFARDYNDLDFSDRAANAMFDYESKGIGIVNHYGKVDGKINGFAVGKHLMDIQIAMWKESLNDPFILSKYELLTDPTLKEIRWFLEELFGTIVEDNTSSYYSSDIDLIKFIRKYIP